ncbi:MAG: LacI family DNA-binding transcriptional regulator [Deinococcales bacterium]
MSSSMPTIHDVAALAGVSPSTAKRAIHQPDKLAKETLAKVLKAIDALGYEPDQTASALRRGRNLSIGLLVGDILEPFFTSLTHIIGQEVRAKGYSLLIADNQYQADLELQNLKMFSGHKISGLIIRPAYGNLNAEYLKRLEARGTIIIEIDYTHDNSPFSHILLNNEQAVGEAVRYLYDLGHERIAFVGNHHTTECPEERHKGFLQTVKALSLPYENYLAKDMSNLSSVVEHQAYDATIRLMQLSQAPTALVSISGMCGVGVFRALKELKLRIPEDVSLITFDNYPWTNLVSPPLDVIEQPVEVMAKTTAELLLSEIESPTKAITKKRFPAKLIRRGSCAPPKKS